jgi:hypothetical protein
VFSNEALLASTLGLLFAGFGALGLLRADLDVGAFGGLLTTAGIIVFLGTGAILLVEPRLP